MGKTIEISLHSSSPIRFDKRDELRQRAGEKVATVYLVGNWVDRSVDSDRCIFSCTRCYKILPRRFKICNFYKYSVLFIERLVYGVERVSFQKHDVRSSGNARKFSWTRCNGAEMKFSFRSGRISSVHDDFLSWHANIEREFPVAGARALASDPDFSFCPLG